MKGICCNLRCSWVICVSLLNFCNFSQLVLSTHPLLLYQFLSSYQTFVIFSPFVICSLFTLSTHPINPPDVHISDTTLTPVLSCTRSLRQYTFPTQQTSLAIVRFWCEGIEAGGFLQQQLNTLWIFTLLLHRDFASALPLERFAALVAEVIPE